MAAEPVPEQTAYQQPPVQSYAPPQQQAYQQPYQQPQQYYQQPYATQAYPPPQSAYVNVEPEVGWWKLIIGVVFFAISFFTCFGFFIGIVFIVWFAIDWFQWYQWKERNKIR
jgi:hypothetical protein